MKNPLNKYIPKNKHDLLPIQKLARHPYPFYREILPDLLEWIQDRNWPVAKAIIPLLIQAKDDLAPFFKKIFASDDTLWIYWCLFLIHNDLPEDSARSLVNALKDDLIQKAFHASEKERLEDIPDLALEILRKYFPEQSLKI